MQKKEDLIEQLELQKTASEKELAKPEVYSNPDNLLEMTTEFEKICRQLDREQKQWEIIANKIDAAESQLQTGT